MEAWKMPSLHFERTFIPNKKPAGIRAITQLQNRNGVNLMPLIVELNQRVGKEMFAKERAYSFAAYEDKQEVCTLKGAVLILSCTGRNAFSEEVLARVLYF